MLNFVFFYSVKILYGVPFHATATITYTPMIHPTKPHQKSSQLQCPFVQRSSASFTTVAMRPRYISGVQNIASRVRNRDQKKCSCRSNLKYFIKQLNKWCVGVDVFWCQGPLFDYAILQNFYAQMEVPVPWNFWQIRDSRTLGSLVPRDPNEKRTGLHNALDDCYFQARKVQQIFQQLEIKNDRY